MYIYIYVYKYMGDPMATLHPHPHPLTHVTLTPTLVGLLLLQERVGLASCVRS